MQNREPGLGLEKMKCLPDMSEGSRQSFCRASLIQDCYQVIVNLNQANTVSRHGLARLLGAGQLSSKSPWGHEPEGWEVGVTDAEGLKTV